MKKGCFVLPYFGKFNSYFNFYLKSCAANPDYDWLIITDDKRNYNYPSNVRVIYMSFAEMRQKIQEKFDFKIALPQPYKLCDYKTTYGYVFSEYLKDYQMWGFCDCDLIWGNINDFISDEMISSYDKIGIHGHCTLFRNDPQISQIFMKKLDGDLRYRWVFSRPKHLQFDEGYNKSINCIFENEGLRVFKSLTIADIECNSASFKLCHADEFTHEYSYEKKRDFFVWDEGHLRRYYLDGGIDGKMYDEYMYIHLIRRPMHIRVSPTVKRFKIIPDSIAKIERWPITRDNIKEIEWSRKWEHFNRYYFKRRSNNLRIKIGWLLFGRKE